MPQYIDSMPHFSITFSLQCLYSVFHLLLDLQKAFCLPDGNLDHDKRKLNLSLKLQYILQELMTITKLFESLLSSQ